MTRLLIILTCFLLLTVNCANAANPSVTVFGLENGAHFTHDRQAGLTYLLQIGAYKSQRNALETQHRYKRVTNFPVRVIPPKHALGTFCVVIGPFTDPLLLKQVSQQLLSDKKTVATPAIPLQPATQSQHSLRHDSLVPETILPVHKERSLEYIPLEKSALKLKSRRFLENRSQRLKAELANINFKLNSQTDQSRISALKNRKEQINKELDIIVAMVIQWISHG